MMHDLKGRLAELAAREATVEAQRRMADREGAQEHWHLVTTPGGEARACTRLGDQGVDFYCPMIRTMRPVPRRKLKLAARNSPIVPMEEKLVPFLRSYLLVRLDLTKGLWRELFDIAGIAGVIGVQQGGRALPLRVSDAVIAALRKREVNGAIPGETKAPEFMFEVGESVRICDGAYERFDATVAEIPDVPIGGLDESATMKLFVGIFGRQNLVEIPVRSVAKL